MEQKINDAETNDLEEQQIRVLIGDLEDKVQGLILENERLNSLLADLGQDK